MAGEVMTFEVEPPDPSGAGDVRHELGNASLLLDTAIRLLVSRDMAETDAVGLDVVVELLSDVKRRIDQIAP